MTPRYTHKCPVCGALCTYTQAALPCYGSAPLHPPARPEPLHMFTASDLPVTEGLPPHSTNRLNKRPQ